MTSADPCTGARKAGHRSGADSPRGIDHGQFDGARVPPRWSEPQGAIGRSRRIGSVLEGYAALGRRPRVTLRFATLHFARPAAGIQEPHERGTGGRVVGGETWKLAIKALRERAASRAADWLRSSPSYRRTALRRCAPSQLALTPRVLRRHAWKLGASSNACDIDRLMIGC